MTALCLAIWNVASFLLVLAPSPETPPHPEVTRLTDFLADGFNREEVSEREIKREYRTVLRKSTNRTSIDYAYALILIHRGEFEEGSQQLRELMRQTEPAFAPAWKASIWHELTRYQYDTAFEQLSDFAEMTADPEQTWTSHGSPEESAQWIGTLLAALSIQFDSGMQFDEVSDLIVTLQDQFSGKRVC